jgi:hypothetical protein
LLKESLKAKETTAFDSLKSSYVPPPKEKTVVELNPGLKEQRTEMVAKVHADSGISPSGALIQFKVE